jgi:hypothetical protein
MSDEDEPVTEIAAPPVLVPETNRLWRLTPLHEKSRQIAIVPAETEDVARAIATRADPMGGIGVIASRSQRIASRRPSGTSSAT